MIPLAQFRIPNSMEIETESKYIAATKPSGLVFASVLSFATSVAAFCSFSRRPVC
jgi:hypothetical protein